MSPLPLTIPPDALHVFRTPVVFCLFNITWTYLASIITGNASQVDRVWTFLPTIYSGYAALTIRNSVGELSQRALLMFGLEVLWMCRLSYNTWRRGLFNLTDEDYRWVILRAKIPPFIFQIFNITFIAIIQNFLLLMLGLPTFSAALHPTPLVASDYVLAAISLATLIWEFTADNQQWSYHHYKHSTTHDPHAWPGADLKFIPADRSRGFLTRGLWAWCRHPNFLAEQTFWVLMTLFPLMPSLYPGAWSQGYRADQLLQLTPAISLILLFVSSTAFTESISVSKYPVGYRAYQRRVSMFFPLLTPLHGLWLSVIGDREAVDNFVYGIGAEEYGDRKTK